MLDFVAAEINPDMFIWTGDNSSHNVWDNTVEEVTQYTIDITNMIKDRFDSTDITVLAIQGNHDTWPVDVQDFSAPGINYPINNFKSYWSDWLTEDAMVEFGKYGYYSQEVSLNNGKKLPEGSRVIAINT